MEGELMKWIEVLGNGYVELIDHMPQQNMDLRVVQTARTSFDRVNFGDDRDYKLLKYLIEHKHLSPFESCTFQFKIRCDMATARQWFRYRTGKYSEISRRYTEVGDDEFYIPNVFRTQSINNKQGSDGVLSEFNSQSAIQFYKHAVYKAKGAYKKLLELGVAREQARYVLPMAQMTTFVWTIDARNLIWGFLRERTDSHAQFEIRQYANAVLEIVKELMPKTIEYSGLFGEM